MSDSEEELSVPEGWSLEDVSLPEVPEAEQGDKCPVCLEHTDEDNLNAQGLVIEGIRAMLEMNDKAISDIAACLTPYDGHVAITMATIWLHDLCQIFGVPEEIILSAYRNRVNGAQAEGA